MLWKSRTHTVKTMPLWFWDAADANYGFMRRMMPYSISNSSLHSLKQQRQFWRRICVCFWRYVSGMTSAPAASSGLLLMKFWTIYPQIWPVIHVSGVAELLRITAAKVKRYWHYLRADGITRHLLCCALLIKIVKAFSRKYSFIFKRVFGNSFEITTI